MASSAAGKKASSLKQVLAKGKMLHELAKEERGKPLSLDTKLLLDGSCNMTLGSLMSAEGLSYEQAVEVMHRFRSEAAPAPAEASSSHPKAGGYLPEFKSASPNGPKSEDAKSDSAVKRTAGGGLFIKSASDAGSKAASGTAAVADGSDAKKRKKEGSGKDEAKELAQESLGEGREPEVVTQEAQGAKTKKRTVQEQEEDPEPASKPKKLKKKTDKAEEPEAPVEEEPKKSKKKTDKAEEPEAPVEEEPKKSKKKHKAEEAEASVEEEPKKSSKKKTDKAEEPVAPAEEEPKKSTKKKKDKTKEPEAPVEEEPKKSTKKKKKNDKAEEPEAPWEEEPKKSTKKKKHDKAEEPEAPLEEELKKSTKKKKNDKAEEPEAPLEEELKKSSKKKKNDKAEEPEAPVEEEPVEEEADIEETPPKNKKQKTCGKRASKQDKKLQEHEPAVPSMSNAASKYTDAEVQEMIDEIDAQMQEDEDDAENEEAEEKEPTKEVQTTRRRHTSKRPPSEEPEIPAPALEPQAKESKEEGWGKGEETWKNWNKWEDWESWWEHDRQPDGWEAGWYLDLIRQCLGPCFFPQYFRLHWALDSLYTGLVYVETCQTQLQAPTRHTS